MPLAEELKKIIDHLPENVRLVAVSKTMPLEVLMEAYRAGQRIFGENKVQELVHKYEELPKDIEWHYIGHLQTNKVKYIAGFVQLIHAVDSLKLLKVIDKEAQKANRCISCLLQIKIASEDSKFGLSRQEAVSLLQSESLPLLKNIRISGLMGMASYTDDSEQVRREFQNLYTIFKKLKEDYFKASDDFSEISMGMSHDYPIALEEGATLIRVGSLIFGERNYNT
ncbi:MAG: YggS family pyridoxal phosphate-dependent enzyme [Bacteroidales bacterium]|nr:YggS family pyridoxal phosphate-dependent enzyme [Bacteroidales bacterium]